MMYLSPSAAGNPCLRASWRAASQKPYISRSLIIMISLEVGLVVVIGSVPIGAGTMVFAVLSFSVLAITVTPRLVVFSTLRGGYVEICLRDGAAGASRTQ